MQEEKTEMGEANIYKRKLNEWNKEQKIHHKKLKEQI